MSTANQIPSNMPINCMMMQGNRFQCVAGQNEKPFVHQPNHEQPWVNPVSPAFVRQEVYRRSITPPAIYNNNATPLHFIRGTSPAPGGAFAARSRTQIRSVSPAPPIIHQQHVPQAHVIRPTMVPIGPQSSMGTLRSTTPIQSNVPSRSESRPSRIICSGPSYTAPSTAPNNHVTSITNPRVSLAPVYNAIGPNLNISQRPNAMYDPPRDLTSGEMKTQMQHLENRIRMLEKKLSVASVCNTNPLNKGANYRCADGANNPTTNSISVIQAQRTSINEGAASRAEPTNNRAVDRSDAGVVPARLNSFSDSTPNMAYRYSIGGTGQANTSHHAKDPRIVKNETNVPQRVRDDGGRLVDTNAATTVAPTISTMNNSQHTTQGKMVTRAKHTTAQPAYQPYAKANYTVNKEEILKKDSIQSPTPPVAANSLSPRSSMASNRFEWKIDDIVEKMQTFQAGEFLHSTDFVYQGVPEYQLRFFPTDGPNTCRFGVLCPPNAPNSRARVFIGYRTMGPFKIEGNKNSRAPQFCGTEFPESAVTEAAVGNSITVGVDFLTD
eukprot:GHVL01018420.1.p1 GENE.GHVL01018420.1~~GHVL01018420.1.p1  ORF type:complete len:552 (+),score=71.12 GHVL01018420.1:196-1851(+)